MEDMKSNAFFHVVETKTTYNMLLGWPWIHENGVMKRKGKKWTLGV